MGSGVNPFSDMQDLKSLTKNKTKPKNFSNYYFQGNKSELYKKNNTNIIHFTKTTTTNQNTAIGKKMFIFLKNKHQLLRSSQNV